MKIRPSNRFLIEVVEENGGVLVLVGSRLDESANRARSIRKHIAGGGAINPHTTIRGAWMWAPIRELTTEEVWDALAPLGIDLEGHEKRTSHTNGVSHAGEAAATRLLRAARVALGREP